MTMSHPKYQKQHRISKVYLKEFGYQKDGKWYISIWEKSKDYTDNILIEEFTTETNIFDLPFDEASIKRHFEDTSQKIETQYKIVLNAIKKQQQLTHRHQDLLCHYTANLICRSKLNRAYFQSRLNSEIAISCFLEEITMFEPESLQELKGMHLLVPSEHRLNLVIGNVMNYLVRVLRCFSFSILEAIPDRGWFTTDNPVLIDPQEAANIESTEYLYIIPVESEIYLPLSPEYCLFGFHKKSNKQENPLRKVPLNKICKIDEETHDRICKMILGNGSQYFIFNQEIKNIFLCEL